MAVTSNLAMSAALRSGLIKTAAGATFGATVANQGENRSLLNTVAGAAHGAGVGLAAARAGGFKSLWKSSSVFRTHTYGAAAGMVLGQGTEMGIGTGSLVGAGLAHGGRAMFQKQYRSKLDDAMKAGDNILHTAARHAEGTVSNLTGNVPEEVAYGAARGAWLNSVFTGGRDAGAMIRDANRFAARAWNALPEVRGPKAPLGKWDHKTGTLFDPLEMTAEQATAQAAGRAKQEEMFESLHRRR